MKPFLTSTINMFYKPASGQQAGWGLILGIVTWIYGDLTYSLLILCLFTFIDFLTGLLKAAILGQIASSKMSKTAYKLAGYLVFVALMHICFYHFLPQIPGINPDSVLIPEPMIAMFKVIPHFIIAMLSLREIMSNVENLTIAGIIPEKVANLFSKILHRVDDKIVENATEQGDKSDG